MSRTLNWFDSNKREQLTYKAALAAGPGPAVTITGNHTLSEADAGKILEVNSATAVTITVPAATFQPGQSVKIVQIGAGQVTLAGGGGLVLNSPTTLKTNGAWSEIVVRFRTADHAVLAGNISAT